MARVAFILGAGASAQGGCPCMGDFFDRAQDLFWTGALGEYASDFEAVQSVRASLQEAQSKARIDLHNLESVFNAIEMALFLHPDDGPERTRYVQGRRSLLRLIVGTLERTQKYAWHGYRNPSNNTDGMECFGPDGYSVLLQAMQNVLGRRSDVRFDFVTFNYDIGLDFALAARRI